MTMPPVKMLLRSAGLRQFCKFGMIGGLGFCVDWGFLHIGINGLGRTPQVAGLFSFPFAVTFTWIGNRLFTFRDVAHLPVAEQFSKFVAVCAVGLVFNRGTYTALVTYVPFVHAWPVIGLLAGTGAGMFFNFFAARRHVFKN